MRNWLRVLVPPSAGAKGLSYEGHDHRSGGSGGTDCAGADRMRGRGHVSGTCSHGQPAPTVTQTRLRSSSQSGKRRRFHVKRVRERTCHRQVQRQRHPEHRELHHAGQLGPVLVLLGLSGRLGQLHRDRVQRGWQHRRERGLGQRAGHWTRTSRHLRLRGCRDPLLLGHQRLQLVARPGDRLGLAGQDGMRHAWAAGKDRPRRAKLQGKKKSRSGWLNPGSLLLG
jgi:hypothetical protein